MTMAQGGPRLPGSPAASPAPSTSVPTSGTSLLPLSPRPPCVAGCSLSLRNRLLGHLLPGGDRSAVACALLATTLTSPGSFSLPATWPCPWPSQQPRGLGPVPARFTGRSCRTGPSPTGHLEKREASLPGEGPAPPPTRRQWCPRGLSLLALCPRPPGTLRSSVPPAPWALELQL